MGVHGAKTQPQDQVGSQESVPVLGEDQVVLEVKFNDYLPGVLATALEDIPRANLAISKYVLCLNLI